jgi:hypothetical protein
MEMKVDWSWSHGPQQMGRRGGVATLLLMQMQVALHLRPSWVEWSRSCLNTGHTDSVGRVAENQDQQRLGVTTMGLGRNHAPVTSAGLFHDLGWFALP